MTPYRQAAVTAYICILIGTFAVFAIGATGLLPVKDPFVWFSGGTFAAGILAPLVVAFKIPGFWSEDPHDVANLQRRHAEEIAHFRKKYLDAMAEKDATHLKVVTELQATHEKETKKLKLQLQNLVALLPPQPKKQVLIEGSARTNEKH